MYKLMIVRETVRWIVINVSDAILARNLVLRIVSVALISLMCKTKLSSNMKIYLIPCKNLNKYLGLLPEEIKVNDVFYLIPQSKKFSEPGNL